MQLPIDFFLALRYLKPKRTFVSVITLLSILGPLLGVAILIIVTSVMAGFERDIKEGIMSMQAHLTVYPPVSESFFAEPAELIAQLEAAGGKEGLQAAPVIEGTALLQLRSSVYPKVIRGIDPDQESKVTKLQQNFLLPNYYLKEGDTVIGTSLARQLGLRAGDDFLVHSPAHLTQNIQWRDDGKVDISEPDELYLPEECRVANFYSMGVSDYDDNVVIVHLDQAADLFGLPWGSASIIQAVVAEPLTIAPLAEKLRERFPDLQFITWQEKNQLFFNTIQSEKNLMTFLMAFIVLVASFAIAATLITVAVQKTREIGIMKAVGVSSFTIGRIFLFQGALIGMIGTALGTAAGLAVLHYREAIAKLLSTVMGVEVFPAEVYHLTAIPALTTGSDLLRIVIMSLAICIGASLVPALYASCFSPAKSLHAEI